MRGRLYEARTPETAKCLLEASFCTFIPSTYGVLLLRIRIGFAKASCQTGHVATEWQLVQTTIACLEANTPVGNAAVVGGSIWKGHKISLESLPGNLRPA